MKHNLYFVILCFLLASCAASLPYTFDYPLTKELFRSRDGEFSGKVPEGWFASPLDSLPSVYKAWLIKEDYSATFHVEELKLDQLSAKQVVSNGIKLLAQLSVAFHKENSEEAAVIVQPKEFKLHGMEFSGYELQDGGERQRVVVFSIKGKYYECVAAPVKREWSTESLVRLFSVQQTLLSTLMFD